MVTARPPFQKGDIVTTKDNSRQIEVTGYGSDPEAASGTHKGDPMSEVKKVVFGFYVNDNKKAEHYFQEQQLKFVRSQP